MNSSSAPAIDASRALLGTAAVLVWNDIVAPGREAFYEWHDKEHIPERLAIPGFRRGRRFARAGHSPEWLTWYEADDLEVLVSDAYLARLNAPTSATTNTLKFFRNTSRAVCRVVHTTGSSNGAHVLALRLEAPAAQSAAVTGDLVERLLPHCLDLTGVLACHLFSADQEASRLNTAESSTRSFDVPSWVVLVEASTVSAAENARRLLDDNELVRLGSHVRADATIYTLEISRLAQPA